MKILFLSKSGDGLGIGDHLVREGHEVKFYLPDPQYKMSNIGIVERTDSWRANLDWADYALCDMVGFGSYQKVFEKKNVPYLGCSLLADAIELDRQKGIEVFRRAGIRIPKTWYFDSPKAYLESDADKEEVVLKPNGNISTAKTFVCHRREETIYNVSTYKKDQPFIVQKLVKGIEVSTEGWFNGKDWVYPFNHTFEKKRFLTGDLGQNTGCQGNVVINAGKGDKLTKETVELLTPFLRKSKYRGPIDINTIVNEQGAFALELTPRFGYDAIEALIEGITEDVGRLFYEIAIGERDKMLFGTDVTIAVRLSIPPFPYDNPSKEDIGVPIFGITKDNRSHIFMTDVYRRGNDYFSAGGDNVLMKVTARGRSVSEARTRVYRTLKNIMVTNKQYRTDIGQDTDKAIEKLKVWGYL